MSNEALNKLPHKLATLIQCLPQAPFREHLAAECIKQAERIAELELQPAFAQLASDLAEKLAATEAERDQLRIDLDDELCNREVLDTMLTQCIAERDQLRAEVERYHHLRNGQSWPAVFAYHDAPEPLRGEDLDTAIDHARTTHKDEG